MSYVTCLLLIYSSTSLAQFGFDDGFDSPFGGPPMGPFGGGFGRHRWGHHRHRHWPHRPPWMRGPEFAMDMEDEEMPPLFPQSEFQPFPPAPMQMPPPMEEPSFSPPAPPAPATDAYSPRIRQLITNVDRLNSAFRMQSYEQVVEAIKRYHTQKSGIQFDPSRIFVTTGAPHNELRANRDIAGAMFESDMMLTLAQINSLTSHRKKRKVTSDMSKRWSTQISYKFNDNDGTWQNMIRSALRMYESNTCLRFTENGRSTDIIVFNKGEGCFSGVGKLGGQQEVSLGSGCETVGIASHEIGHALGLWHEQSRPNRDSYVRINYPQVVHGFEGSFQKRSTSESMDYGVPYDYGSLMHYASNSFTKSFAEDTIVPLKSQFKATIGNRVEPAFLDYKVINEMYCRGRCRSLPCQNGGYTNPSSCNLCVCPTGFGGTYCDRLAPSSCGGELTASTGWLNLAYSGSSTCYWRIRSPNRGRIRFKVTNVKYACQIACEEFVEIKYNTAMDLTGARMCCSATVSEAVSEADYIIIISRATQASQFSIQYMNEGGVVARPAPRPAPPPRRVPPSSGSWAGWSGWSACSEKCGACGTRTRTRRCSAGRCSGSSSQSQVCNMNACVRGTTLAGSGRRGKRSVFEDLIHSGTRSKRSPQYWCCERFLARGTVCVSVTRRRSRSSIIG